MKHINSPSKSIPKMAYPKFWPNFSLKSYFFYFAWLLYKTLTSNSLYSTLFHYNIISSFIFYYIL